MQVTEAKIVKRKFGGDPLMSSSMGWILEVKLRNSTRKERIGKVLLESCLTASHGLEVDFPLLPQLVHSSLNV